MKTQDRIERITAARKSLDGLSIGDAFGQTFFAQPENILPRIRSRILPQGALRYTDDTVMALSIVDVLAKFGHIEQDELARLFAIRFEQDPTRGYGSTAFEILDRISRGADWRVVSKTVFGGTGSMGNGASMRAGPIGAYYNGNEKLAVENARLSAEITHAHTEGQAGAIAVAVAACHFASGRDVDDIFNVVLEFVPQSATRDGIEQASKISKAENVLVAARALGSGGKVLSQDTVFFCIWCVHRSCNDFLDSLWTMVEGIGDLDTTCAIVGSIVASRRGITIPNSKHWIYGSTAHHGGKTNETNFP